MSKAFVIHPRDNVATALAECVPGQSVTILGESSQSPLTPLEMIRPEHKISLVDILKGEAVIKYGMAIGHACKPIAAGAWVHLHNCASNFDERSNTLDGESGAPTDMSYE